jgi:hypothetical protein
VLVVPAMGGDVLPAVDVPALPASVPPAAEPAASGPGGSLGFVPSAQATPNARNDTAPAAIRPTCLMERANTLVIAYSPKNSSLDGGSDLAEIQNE